MYAKVAAHATENLVKSGIIAYEDKPIYAYGVEIGLAMLLNLATTLLIGIILGMVPESMAFLAAFIPLRSYAGGYHASSHFKCYWLSVAAVIITLFVVKISAISIVPAIIGCTIILILAPVQDMNKPLDETEIYVYRIRARLVLCIESIVAITLRVIGFRAVSDTIFLIFFLVGISVIVGFLKNKRSDANGLD